MHLTNQTEFGTIDIGKNVNWLRIFRGFTLEPVMAPLKVRTTQDGLALVQQHIDARLAHCDHFYLALEPTGIYHENWARALEAYYQPYITGATQPRIDFRFLNPHRVKLKRQELHGRNRKTDPIDLVAMAYCLRDGLGYPVWLPVGAALLLQEWIRAFHQASRERRHLQRQILTQLDRVWPGAVINVKRFQKAHPDLEPPSPIVKSKPLERQRLRAFLIHCPNPHDTRDLGPTGIQDLLRAHVGRCGPKTAQHVYQILQDAVLPPPAVATVLAQRLQRDFQRYLELELHLTDLETQATTLVPHSPAAVLDTVPGISAFLAARYLAGVGHQRRFDHPKRIWACAGFDVLTADSGDSQRVGHISKRGDSTFRDTLFLIGWHTSRHCPPIQQAYQRARRRDMGDVGATIHAAHKANRLCWRLLYDQVPYDPQRHR